MRTFAYIFHPITIKELKNYWPAINIMPDFIVRSSLKKISPFKASHIKKVRSRQEGEIEGDLILCPLLAKEMLELEEVLVLDKILASIQAAERLGARIVGLGGHISMLADKGFRVLKKLKIPVTTGSTFTAWSVIEAIYRISRAKNRNLKKSTLAVIGATGSVGSLCARKLSEYALKIVISGNGQDKLERLKKNILNFNSIQVIVEGDPHKAVKDADIVVYATSLPEGDSSIIQELKPDAIVCDVSLTRDMLVNANARSDITVVEGGLIKLPYQTELGINMGLPKDIIPAPLAETMLLTFKERFVSYSLGEIINLDKLEEIADIAVQHGFEVWVPDAPVL